jgi:hypothetical protein
MARSFSTLDENGLFYRGCRNGPIAECHCADLACFRITAENFKFSKDPQFVEKVRDIVGLYRNPPDRTVVVCLDEKNQVQG